MASIIKINAANYEKFDDMIFFRMNERQKTAEERKAFQISNETVKSLQNSNLSVYAIEEKDDFIGWISLVYLPKIGKFGGRGFMYVDELWIHPDFRRKGFARMLMEQGEKLAQEFDAVGLRLYVWQHNESAIALYDSCGYENKGGTYYMEKEFI